MDFKSLVKLINEAHNTLQQQASKAVNISLTLRNWLIGFYIVEFEQHGKDRAKYGVDLLGKLAASISIKGLTSPELSRCRQFYKIYPHILGALTQESKNNFIQILSENMLPKRILGTVSQELETIDGTKGQSDLQNIIHKIPYSHFAELIKIDDDTKRKYYELLIIKTNLSVRELKRQISTLSYERLGISKNKTKALEQVTRKITPGIPQDVIKSHYFFEFLNVNKPDLIEETELEQALTDHLQTFIIELGNGFCFEGRQKRILIGDEYFFVDLVFYHRILKCHVLIELKVDSFSHAHAAQLVTYLNYYKSNILEKGDNPPIGILLVTDKNKTLVEYATANDKDRLFVSKYKLNLPSVEELKEFIENELRGER
ncbi:MAG: PDDEXK nuclease domain-containing protein [Deltaproteobacteria bacterium]|nr:PDDEXK nuclease domain-containing protein [Deltaproteobacteria bacterium]